MRHVVLALAVSFFCCCIHGDTCLLADGPKDNHPESVRRIPALGIEVSPEDRDALNKGLAELAERIKQLESNKAAQRLLPDVQIYHRAVDVALRHQEFFAPGDIAAARELLAEGLERARQLAAGQTPWTTQTGLVVRGYRSRLDQTVQPYGLVVPENYAALAASRSVRLDAWFHGRGETLSEVKFIQGRRKQVGVFSPDDTIVLHPYGRYSNANKFAGEIDVLESIEHVRENYAIDGNRIAVRGFSMGGASTWQLAVHYPSRWVAANPGAGFSETPEFLRTFQAETLRPTWWERKLWHWYDCDDWAVNLTQCPTVAYSGEIDRQKQAADVMEAALAEQGVKLIHVIGPKTGHSYHPDSREIVDRKMSQLAALGRRRIPRDLHFVTYTLRYNRCGWLTIDGLDEHWEQARVDGKLLGAGIQLSTKNVAAMTLSLPTGTAPFDGAKPVKLTVDGEQLDGGPVSSDRSWQVSLVKREGRWQLGRPEAGLRKRHLLQGPIDDAFMDSFMFVRPTGKSKHELVDKWSQAELERAVEHWRRHFRGDAIVKDDTQVTQQDLETHHVVLWGDVDSNALLAKLAGELPIRWTAKELAVGDAHFEPEHHAPVMIYPNPLHPQRYVVVNSSFTFREYAYLNNARQVPMLPDWAVVDLRQAPTSQWPGRIAAAGFFDEQWRLRPADLERSVEPEEVR
ncbi:MAG: prolyl oligopeptidase family serine peptidase [Planctomycetales bacterium]|nr:prolyl oligopeptidase family serine peptidase [Planctomycetales bacterium]